MYKSVSKRILSLIIVTVLLLSILPIINSAEFTAKAAITEPVSPSSDWNKVVDGWYTSTDGGFKFNVGDWLLYENGSGQIKIAESTTIPCNCACIMAYGPDSGSVESEEVFENKTAANFKPVLQEDIIVFEKTTVGNGSFTMYYARTASYENYVFQHNNTKYFINFIYGYTTDRDAFAKFAADVMSTIVIADDPAPVDTQGEKIDYPVSDPSQWNKIVDGWYTSTDGGFKFNVGDWLLYENGSGQIKIVESTTFPCSCAAIMAYGPDSGYVDSPEDFERKNAMSMKAILQEDILDFKKTTVGNSKFTMYYTRTESYETYVFQANGTKYFINFIYGYTTDRDAYTQFVADVMSTIVIADDAPIKEGIFKVSHKLEGGKLVFDVVTTGGSYNRVKAALEDNLNGYVGYTNSYTVNGNGDYVWTIKIDAPQTTTRYAFDLRSSETGKYQRDYFYYEAEIMREGIKYVTHTISGGKIIFTVVSGAWDYNRIKATLASNLGGSIAVGTYTVNADGDYVWTVKAPAPTETTEYAFDLRNGANKYLKDYFFYTVEAEASPIKSVTHSFEGSKLVFTVVTTSGAYNRVKATLSSNLSGSLGVGTEYTVNSNGEYVWTIKIASPSETTSYAFDLRNTEGKYLKAYFEYTVQFESIFKDVSCSEFGGGLIFTVVTNAGNYNALRCGLSLAQKDTLATCENYRVNENGDYVWIIAVWQPEGKATLYFSLRSADTNNYLNIYYPVVVGNDNARPDPNSSSNWKKVVNGVFTSDKGGIQLDCPGWKTYGLYSISMVPEEYNNVGQTNAICVAVYDKDSGSMDTPEAFENKTKADMENVLQVEVNSFTKTTISYGGKSYTCYKAVVTGVYYVWLFQTENAKYFFNFMQADGAENMQTVGENMMNSIRIFK